MRTLQILFMLSTLSLLFVGCSHTIDKDTKLSLTGPRAKVTRSF